MTAINVRFNHGLRTIMDPAHIAPGELQEATGIYYRTGDKRRAVKIGGRSIYDNLGSGFFPVRGIYLAQYEAGQDFLLALIDSKVNQMEANTSGSVTLDFRFGLSDEGRLYGAHFGNRHYMVEGTKPPWVVEYDPDDPVLSTALSYHDAGLSSPVEAPTVVTAAVVVPSPLPRASVATPEVLPGLAEWVKPDRIFDVDEDNPITFAAYKLLGAGTYAKLTASGFAPDTTSGRVLQVTWRVAGAQGSTGDGGAGSGGGGGQAGGTPPAPTPKAGFNVKIFVEYSLNITAPTPTWSELAYFSDITAAIGNQRVQIPISVDSSLVGVRMWGEYVSGFSTAVIQWTDVSITTATVANFSTTAGYRVCYTEFDATRNEESPQSPDSRLVELASENTAVYTLPATLSNSRATHRRIYCLPDGGAAPHQYGLKAMIPASQTTYTELYEVPVDVQLSQLLRLVTITDPQSGGTVRFPADTPPPLLSHINAYAGSLVGVTPDGDVRYSLKGAPNSWPEIYLLNDMPFQQNDLPIATATVGNTLIIAASEIIMARDGIPRAEDGTINRSPTRPISGQPGCVGPDAIKAYSVDGAARAAWVSRYGIHETDGYTGRMLSKALDWENDLDPDFLSSCLLHYDERRRLLYFCADTDGDGLNDRYWTGHMAADMRDDDGLPLWTGPHYGNIACLASGQVDSAHRLFSGHTENGNIYLENSGSGDDSLAYDGTTEAHPLFITSGRLYDEANRRRLFVGTAVIRHTDAGVAQTAEITWTAGTDDDQAVQTVTESVLFSGAGAESILIGLAGDWHQVRIVHTGSSPVATPLSLEGINVDAEVMGRTGDVGVY